VTAPQPFYGRSLPDGRYVSVWPMTFGKFRLQVAPSTDSLFFDDGW
jgi:hypothetical protein